MGTFTWPLTSSARSRRRHAVAGALVPAPVVEDDDPGSALQLCFRAGREAMPADGPGPPPGIPTPRRSAACASGPGAGCRGLALTGHRAGDLATVALVRPRHPTPRVRGDRAARGVPGSDAPAAGGVGGGGGLYGPGRRRARRADGGRRRLAGVAAWAGGVLFIPSLAFLSGTLARTPRLFQALYVPLWYLVLNGVAAQRPGRGGGP